jgi:hypothetical protein
VAVVTSEKNWLPGRKIFVSHGFEKVDEMENCELYVRRLKNNVSKPRFNTLSRKQLEIYRNGLTILESPQCPYSCGGITTLRELASKARVPFKVEHLASHKEAQKNGLHPYGTFCVVLNGEVVSHYPGDVKEVRKLLAR